MAFDVNDVPVTYPAAETGAQLFSVIFAEEADEAGFVEDLIGLAGDSSDV